MKLTVAFVQFSKHERKDEKYFKKKQNHLIFVDLINSFDFFSNSANIFVYN